MTTTNETTADALRKVMEDLAGTRYQLLTTAETGDLGYYEDAVADALQASDEALAAFPALIVTVEDMERELATLREALEQSGNGEKYSVLRFENGKCSDLKLFQQVADCICCAIMAKNPDFRGIGVGNATNAVIDLLDEYFSTRLHP